MSDYSDLILGTSGLVGYWRLGEPSGTTVVDAFGTLDGTSSNVTLGAAGALAGDNNTAYTFNGTTAYVTLGNPAALQLSTGSVEAWFKATDAGAGHRGIVTKSGAYGIYFESNILSFYDFAFPGANRPSAIDASDGAWHHVVLTFQSGVASGAKLYLDGSLVLTSQMTIDNQSSGVAIGAGLPDGSIQQFAGSIDDVALYNAVLDAATVAAHYTAGITLPPEPIAATRSSITRRTPHYLINMQAQPVFLTREPAHAPLVPRRYGDTL